MHRSVKDKKCFKCKRNLDKIKKRMIAVDKPYKNLWFCKRCLLELGDNLYEFLLENKDKILYFDG